MFRCPLLSGGDRGIVKKLLQVLMEFSNLFLGAKYQWSPLMCKIAQIGLKSWPFSIFKQRYVLTANLFLKTYQTKLKLFTYNVNLVFIHLLSQNDYKNGILEFILVKNLFVEIRNSFQDNSNCFKKTACNWSSSSVK